MSSRRTPVRSALRPSDSIKEGNRFAKGSWRALGWLLLIILLVAVPLVFDRSFTEQFSYLKILLTKLTVWLGLVAWLLARLWGKLIGFPRSRIILPLAVLSLAVLLSCLHSPVPRLSLREAAYFLCGPVWFLLLTEWAEGEVMVGRVARLAAAAATAVAAIALVQWLGYDPLLWGGYRINWGRMVARMRLYSTLGNPNFVAGYLIGAVFLALALAAATCRRRARLGWSAAGVAMLAAIAGTGSRGAWGGLAAGAVVAGGLLLLLSPSPPPAGGPEAARAHASSKGRRRAGLHGLFVPVGIWLALPALTRFIEVVLGRLEGRLYLWRISWPMFAEHPLLGSGWGSFQLKFLDLQARFLADHPTMARYWSNVGQLHNDPMQLWLETGALGLVAFGWLLWRYGQEVRDGLRGAKARAERWWLAASAGGGAAILFDSIFNFQFSVPPTLLLLFTLLAFPAVLARDTSNEGRSAPATGATDGSVQGKRRLWAVRIVVSLALVVGAGAFVRQTLRQARAERNYAVALRFERRGDWTAAEPTYRQGIALDTLNGRLHFGLARALFNNDQLAAALAETLRAERTYRDSHIEVLRARILDQLGADSLALEAYRHALALDPTLKTVQADIRRLEGTLAEH